MRILFLFGSNLTEVENRLFENLKKTKAVFPEETQHLEVGLALMRDLTQITKEAIKEYPRKPNLFTNHNLFARNRQLLLNAYVSLLFSSYGTQFVILRTVLENNNLMRLFNKNPQYSFEWLSKEIQDRFPPETRSKYGKSGKHDREFKPTFVRENVFDVLGKEKVRSDIKVFYDQLCNYTHPNFLGWREIIIKQPKGIEIILNMPRFQETTADSAVGIALFLTQATFKSFVDTFAGNLADFAHQLGEWQEKNRKLLLKYVPTEKT